MQFLLSYMCEFEILVAVVNSGLLQLPLRSALSHVQHLVGLQLLPRFLTLNASLFPMSCHLRLSRLPVKGWPWLFLILFFCLDRKIYIYIYICRERERERESTFSSSSYFRPSMRE